MLSVLSKGFELNVQQRQVVSMNDLGPFSVVNHIVNDSLILSTVSMQKFLIKSLWAFRCCLLTKTARQYAPIADSNRPTTTPQKNSLIKRLVGRIRTVDRCGVCGSCACTIKPMMLPNMQITRTTSSNVTTIQSPTLGNQPNFSKMGPRMTSSPG